MSHHASKDEPRSSKCHHFCLPFDSHNYCAACTESIKGDDPCVILEKPREILKIKNKHRYVCKQKVTNTSKDDYLDLLGDEDVESFSGSHADLEGAADNLFASPPRPQPLRFEALSLKTPAKTAPPTPGMALRQKIESKPEKSLGSQFNIQLQQQMGAFQASMLEAMKWSWIRSPRVKCVWSFSASTVRRCSVRTWLRSMVRITTRIYPNNPNNPSRAKKHSDK